MIGQVIDTNSAWMAQQLNKIGIAVKKRIAIGDDAQEMRQALDVESQEADLVLLTGGLGPTSDDITKDFLCKYFNGKMVVNEAALENVKYLFEKIYKKPASQVNLLQAEVPDVCEVVQNKRGSAPGMIFKRNNTIFVSMPGVPYEMQGIMNERFHICKKNLSCLQFSIARFLQQALENLLLQKLLQILKSNSRKKSVWHICQIMEW